MNGQSAPTGNSGSHRANGRTSQRTKKGRPVDGIILLDKPTGRSSNDSLQHVKRLFDARKAGHTGSLDKLASGLLPICLGEATKFSGFLLNADKRYVAVMRLGEKTTTGDAEGEVIESTPVEHITADEVEVVLGEFRGDIMQIPPMFSAIKRQGQRLYKLAHKGVVVEREPRPVTIHRLDVGDVEGPLVGLEVDCSKGTYIRTLAEDIGGALGYGARLESLRRVGVGPFDGAQMRTIEDLEALAAEGLEDLDNVLLPLEASIADTPELVLADTVAYYLKQGQAVLVPHAPTSGLVRMYSTKQKFLGVGEVLDDGRIGPRRLIGQSKK